MRSSTALRSAHGHGRWIQVGQHFEERSMRRGFSLDRGQDNEGSGAIVIILRTKSEGRFEKSSLRRVLLHFLLCSYLLPPYRQRDKERGDRRQPPKCERKKTGVVRLKINFGLHAPYMPTGTSNSRTPVESGSKRARRLRIPAGEG